MPRQVGFTVVAGYRGRRSMQALRQDATLGAAGLQKMAAASQQAGSIVVSQIDRIGQKFLRLAQISAFIFGVALVRDFFTAGVGFQKAMSGVLAVSEATTRQFRELGELAKFLGATTVFTATQSAQAMEKLALAGLKVSTIFEILPDVLNLAAAGELEMAEAATIAVGTLKGFNLEVSELSKAIDQMAFTASNSNQTIRDIGVAFSFVGPVASAAGIRFTEVSAALAILANRNLRAERGGTALRRIISILIGDLDEGEKGLAGFGLELVDNEGRSIGLANAIDQINQKGARLTDVMNEFQQRAGPAFLSLMAAGGEAVRRFETRLKLVGDTAKEIAEVRLNNLQGRITLMTSAWRNLAVEIFDNVEPALSRLVNRLRDMFRSMARNQDVTLRWTILIKQLIKNLLILAGLIVGLRVTAGLTALVTFFTALNFRILVINRSLTTMRFTLVRVIRQLKLMGTLGVLAVGAITFEVTRAALEWAGWNDILQEWFLHLIEGKKEYASFVRSLEGQLGVFDKITSAFSLPVGADIIDPKVLIAVRRLINEFNAAGEAGDVLRQKMVFKELEELIPKFDQGVGATFRLQKALKILKDEQPDIFTEGIKGAKTMSEAYDKMIELLDRFIELDEKRSASAVEAAKRMKELTEDAVTFMNKAFSEASFFSEEKLADELDTFDIFREKLGDDMKAIEAFALGATERIIFFQNALANMGEELPENLTAFVNLLNKIIIRTKNAEESADALVEAWDQLADEAGEVGLITAQEISNFTDQFNLWVIAAKAHGRDIGFVLEVMGEDIFDVIQRAEEAGQAVPDALANIADSVREMLLIGEFSDLFREELDKMEAHLDEFGETWVRKWVQFGKSITKTIGDVVGDVISGQKKFSEAGEAALRQLASTAISMLVQWGIQRLVYSNISKQAIISEHASNLAGYMAEVYASSFQSYAAIPIIGWAGAAAVAAANVAAAEAGAAGAAALGSALGFAITAGQFQAGGVAFGPTRGVFGEAGPELLVPLSGERARRAVRDLGIFSGDEGERGMTVNVFQTFTGDNWREDGVSEDLTDAIGESLEEAVKSGRILDFTVRTR